MNNKSIALGKRTQEVVLFSFNNPRLSQTEIALHFNISPQRVSQIMNSRRVLDSFPMLAKHKAKSLIPKAMGRLEELMNQNENMGVSEKIVGKILDHGEVLVPQPQVIVHELRLKTVEELQEIVDQGKKLSGPVIDAELID